MTEADPLSEYSVLVFDDGQLLSTAESGQGPGGPQFELRNLDQNYSVSGLHEL